MMPSHQVFPIKYIKNMFKVRVLLQILDKCRTWWGEPVM